ncbi:MAG: hypothetical protein IPG54_00635 [Sphingomonadales bacterium]|jgi:hypothetical protein|nr:hypothetical protein [Sphingomonadales bacterium]MBK9003786.1 hypothetical protein [Sphingomonadales bacterium]MBK9268960.1 hypothetical protein [Sphingomonadales bacterium]MBP6435486.1 hypothetical protein [Sphingorhabdus sp.]
MVRGYLVSALLAALVAAGPIHAQSPVVTEKSAVREGFVFPATGEVRVLLFRPDIKIGETTTAGLFQTQAEWHGAARSELVGALRAASERRGLKVSLHDEENAALTEHRALFRLVVSAAIRHKLFGRDPLPSKSGTFDWSLGSGVARIAPQADADYGLFLFSHDSFESAGRRAAQLVTALMGGANNGGAHFGYAALVDLGSGDILWLNVDLKASGDVRTPEGAASRIEQLLAGFPARAGQGQP